MDSCLYHRLYLILCCFNLIILAYSSSSTQPLCHENESKALLQFKHNFVIAKFASADPSAFPKLESWKPLEGEGNGCCSWDGVKCDSDTGHVIGLNLSSSFLHGSINSNSSLFTLVHLHSLNLADNDFNFSKIPSSIGHLPRLTTLNLSNSGFVGQIPSEISSLSKLLILDLSKSDSDSESRFSVLKGVSESPLKLDNPSLRELVQNLTNLEVLDLSGVNISSSVPSVLSNISSLTTIRLERCWLHGEFPMDIFRLPKLQILNAAWNENLKGSLPEFQSSSRLKALKFSGTGFYGKLPDSIGRLESLLNLELSRTYLSGTLPSPLGNLTRLSILYLDDCDFRGQIPLSLANLSHLTELRIGDNKFDAGLLPLPPGKLLKLTLLFAARMNLQGEIPTSLANLTHLSSFDVSYNNLVGKIPSWFMNLTQLAMVDIEDNHLHGTIPSSITQLKHLDYLNLRLNSFTGIVELDMFMKLQKLVYLGMGRNKLTVLTNNSTNGTLPKLQILGLGSCNLVEFPSILRFQDDLRMLFLFDNKIRGEIPTWMWNSSKETLEFLDLNNNFLTGFEQQPAVIPWRLLLFFTIGSNKLQGSLPVPPPSTFYYNVRNNALTGAIPPSMCQKNSLHFLDLSNNNLNGTIPPCLASFSEDLLLLNLSFNSFRGHIPSTFTMNCPFVMIDLSGNQLQGPVPRSLANCAMLECLVLENNQIEDIFPSWLGALPKLELLILGSNKFHGDIGYPQNSSMFQKLRIIDLSSNRFSGFLPTEYIRNWNGMKMINNQNLTYLLADWQYVYLMRVITKGANSLYERARSGVMVFDLSNDTVVGKAPERRRSDVPLIEWQYDYSIRVVSKGTNRLYERIQSALVSIDLSNNAFVGDIPECFGSLSGLQLLNISNNHLTGPIPSSLAKLKELESLDLSQNLLSGQIPQQLTQLTFLSIFNVSHNRLIGRIPLGKQFDTYDNSSFSGNSGLCGVPLSKSCRNSLTSPPPPPIFHGDDLEFSSCIYWVVISLGYGSGLVVGLAIGTALTRKYHNWFVNTFGREKKQKRKGRRT